MPHRPRLRAVWLPAALLAALPYTSHSADSPGLGNPLDALPPRPAEPQPSAPPVVVPQTPASDAQQSTLARIVTPANFDVTGVTALPFADVVAILEPLAGKPTTVAELIAAADRITELYRQQGYVLSFALIQNQDFAGGLVKVTVVEGYVSSTQISGDVGPAITKLQDYARVIEQERPLTRKTLERQLNLMATVAGMKVKPELSLPKRADGATELTLAVDHKAFRFDAGISNLSTGTHAIVTATASSLTPLAEQVQLMAAVPSGSDKLQYYAGNVVVPIGSDGMTIKADAFSYRAEPQNDILQAQGLDREIQNQRAGVSVSYPFIISNQQALTGTAGVYASSSRDTYRSQATGASAQLTTHLRVLHADVTYADSSLLQSRRLTASINKGLDALDARQNQQGIGVNYDLDFTRFTLGGTQSLTLPAQFGLSFSALGQYSSNSLPTSEQITFGGQRFARGYPAGEVGGDKGYGAAFEINRRFATGLAYVPVVQPYVVADAARASLNDSRFTLATRKLASVALGLRVTDQKRYALDLNLAKPVGDRPVNANGRPLRFNANYSFQFE